MPCTDLKINHMKNPLGYDLDRITLSFLPDQPADHYPVQLSKDPKFQDILKEVNVPSAQTHAFDLDFAPQAGTRYYWRVLSGESVSKTAGFEPPLPLSAPAITPLGLEQADSAIVFKTFSISKKITAARLYISGLGLYEASINGQKAGDEYLTPGFTVYDCAVQYQTYDVTDHIKSGQNTLEVILGNGWYKGRFGLGGSACIYGNTLLCKALLVLYTADGGQIEVKTDETWQSRKSFIGENSIYDGEIQEYPEDTVCEKTAVVEESFHFVPRRSAPIREKQILHPTLLLTPNGEQVLDFGQNMAGFVRVKAPLKKGQTLRLTMGELLQKGCFYRDNLRSAKAQFSYTSKGEGTKIRPYFTYYGFRYALVEGLDTIDPAWFEGVVLYSDLEQTGWVETDSPKLNRLLLNALWSQKGNFVDIPTDCPQRDERLGWTGDAQIFSQTACFHMDSQLFFEKWLFDLRTEQLALKGGIPMFAPALQTPSVAAGAVWGDAAIIIPMNLYLQYGDKTLLAKHYPLIKDYLAFVREEDRRSGSKRLYTTGVQLGDWLALDGVGSQSRRGGTEETFIASVYYYHGACLTAQAADILGFKKDQAEYSALAQEIQTAIFNEYFTPSGRLAIDTQTAYVICMIYNLYPDKERLLLGFRRRMAKDLYKMKAGFVGAPLMLNAMFQYGMAEDAYRLLFNEEFPGWLYEVNLGATTIWERWNSLLPDGTISGTSMNSMNHYAYGCVAGTVYQYVLGLQPLKPGWRKARISPHFSSRLSKVSGEYQSVCGTWKIAWSINANCTASLTVSVPVNCEAVLVLADKTEKNLCAGTHELVIPVDRKCVYPFSGDSLIMDILKDKQAREVIEKYLPKLLRLEDKSAEPDDLAKPLEETAKGFHFGYKQEEIDACLCRLETLSAL